MQRQARRIAAVTGAELRLDESIAPFTSMRVGGEVAAMLLPGSTGQLEASVRELRSAGVPMEVLGGGSNLLADDAGLDLVAVHAPAAEDRPSFDGTRARVPGGLSVAALLRELAQRGLGGLEWAAGLPGSVAGAVVGNAGAFGGEFGRHVRAVVLLDASGGRRRHRVREGDFGYRRSFVAPADIVLEVELEFEARPPARVREEINRINRQRSASQPKGGHSSGCMFKNPTGESAGRLIDECGLKGLSQGGARVSETHANFVINDGTATASDIVQLIERVRREVREQRGVQLELEVRRWQGVGDHAEDAR